MLVHDGSDRVMVAKRRATAGDHAIHVAVEGDAQLLRIDVRAIPDIQHSRFPTTVYSIEANGQYDWEFISEYSPYQNISTDRRYPPVLITAPNVVMPTSGPRPRFLNACETISAFE